MWEWCADTYDASAYNKHSRRNPKYASKLFGDGPARVCRGGSFNDVLSLVLCANRGRFTAASRDSDLGLRLVRVAK